MAGKIAYIEDEEFFASVISKKLVDHGFEVDTFADGESGLAAIKGNGYDLVLLDLILPKLDGLEVLKALKEDPHAKNIPVVVLSNQSGEDNQKKAMDLGAKAYYVKVNAMPSEIVTMVAGFLKEKH